MELYVVRHAVAFPRDATRWPDDRDRPLTPEGEERFRRAARGIAKLATTPERIFTSPLPRARRTAEILCEEAGWPHPEELGRLEPDEPPEAIRRALQPHANASALAVVGHEPNLSELASLLLAGDADAVAIDLKKGAVLALDAGLFPEAGGASLLWSIPPRVLRAIR